MNLPYDKFRNKINQLTVLWILDTRNMIFNNFWISNEEIFQIWVHQEVLPRVRSLQIACKSSIRSVTRCLTTMFRHIFIHPHWILRLCTDQLVPKSSSLLVDWVWWNYRGTAIRLLYRFLKTWLNLLQLILDSRSPQHGDPMKLGSLYFKSLPVL